jgi:hypothetical protein
MENVISSLAKNRVTAANGPHGWVGQEDILFVTLRTVSVHQSSQCFYLVFGG